MNPKKCLFCNKYISSNKANEHVIPRWLLEFLEIKNNRTEPTHTDFNGTFKSKRKHILNNLLSGSICNSCNSGWMSALEQNNQEILKSLIIGENELSDLTLLERHNIARWSFKTAICLNFASNFNTIVPANHFEFLFKNSKGLPKRVSVVAKTHSNTIPFFWMQNTTWNLYSEQPDISEVKNLLISQGYKIGLQFGKLLILVSYLPTNDLTYILKKNYHIPLWPQKGRVAWSTEIPEKQETSQDELIRFILTLDVHHDNKKNEI